MPDAKLTLKLDRDAIERGKRLAKERGVSLSRLVEGYIRRLVAEEDLPQTAEEARARLAAECLAEYGVVADEEMLRAAYPDGCTPKPGLDPDIDVFSTFAEEKYNRAD